MEAWKMAKQVGVESRHSSPLPTHLRLSLSGIIPTQNILPEVTTPSTPSSSLHLRALFLSQLIPKPYLPPTQKRVPLPMRPRISPPPAGFHQTASCVCVSNN